MARIDPAVYWVVDVEVAGRPGPGDTPWSLPVLRDMGFNTVVTLDERGLGKDAAREFADAEIRHEPMFIPDFEAPTLDEMWRLCRLVDSECRDPRRKRPVLVCCYGGAGRTGTMLAAYLIWRKGLSWKEAIAEVRRRKSTAVETTDQKWVLSEFDMLMSRRREFHQALGA